MDAVDHTEFAELLVGAKEDLSAERMEALAAVATQDYVVAFKTHRGPELRLGDVVAAT